MQYDEEERMLSQLVAQSFLIDPVAAVLALFSNPLMAAIVAEEDPELFLVMSALALALVVAVEEVATEES